jgi:hypothetical protein
VQPVPVGDSVARRLLFTVLRFQTPTRCVYSDCEIPNCRAILEGVMPALKAARMAFFPLWIDPFIVAAGVAKGQRSRRLDSLAGEIR